MKLLALIAALSLARCGTSAGSPVACGGATCTGTEYCLVTCLCCGTPGGTPSSKSECKPIPAGCSAQDLCSCQGRVSGACTQSSRLVEVPCA